MTMRRREAIKTMGALAGAAVLPKVVGCGGESPITHMVVVMMENRSYDHYLGARSLLEGRPGDGLIASMSNPGVAKPTVPVFRDDAFCIPDPPHTWDQSHRQFANGENSGFLSEYIARHGVDGKEPQPHVMGYYGREELPFIYAMADEFAICDRWFSSVMGPTWPNRLYLLSGQSGGFKTNKLGSGGKFGWPSIFTQLENAGIDWKYYFQDLPFAPLFEDVNIDRVRLYNADFFRDAEEGTLSPITFVEPSFSLNDDHPPHHPILGQQFLATVYNALAQSPLWDNLLFVVTYDEHGGYYDHVAPPKTADDRASDGFDQLGFRVPTLVAGPYVKRDHVSSVVRDHTSVLAHISNMFDLPPLTARVAAANDLSELLDAGRLATRSPRPPAKLPAVEVDLQSIPQICFGGEEDVDLHRIADEGSLVSRWDRRHLIMDDAVALRDAMNRLKHW